MGKKPYRVELYYSKGRPYYHLVKDVRVKEQRTKVRVYLGHDEPSQKEVDNYRKEYAYTIETKAAQKKAEFSSKLYSSKYLSKADIITIETIRHYYKTFTSLLTTSEIDVYEQNFEVDYVQGTTSIEGNTLSRQETRDLLVNNIPPNDKSLREINEVQNFKRVKAYRDSCRGKVSLDFIKTLHSLIMSNIDIDSAGVFRRIDDVWIAGCEIRPTPAILIVSDLSKLIDDYYAELENNIHPFEAAVMFHYEFELIHPFTDGNGRVGREIFNYMLRKCGYPKLLFLGEERTTYIKSLKLGNDEKYAKMIKVFADLITEQRYEILMDKLKTVVVPAQRTTQLRLDAFYSRPIETNLTPLQKSSAR